MVGLMLYMIRLRGDKMIPVVFIWIYVSVGTFIAYQWWSIK